MLPEYLKQVQETQRKFCFGMFNIDFEAQTHFQAPKNDFFKKWVFAN